MELNLKYTVYPYDELCVKICITIITQCTLLLINSY
jgi:hypothetical protein